MHRGAFMLIQLTLVAVLVSCLSSAAQLAAVDGVPAEAECTTDGCKRSAALLLKSMDMSVDPCEDFFRFSCGSYVNDTSIPDDRASVSVISEMGVQLGEQMRALLQETSPPGELRPFALARTLYQACMNTNAQEERGLEPARALIAQLGGWPVLEGSNWNATGFNWVDLNYKLMREGLYEDFIFAFAVYYDITNTSQYAISINIPKLVVDSKGLDPDMVFDIVRRYHKLSTDIAVMFGADPTFAGKEMMDVINFELDLGNITKSREERRDLTSWLNPLNITTLSKKYPYIPWKEYFTNMMYPTSNVSDNDVVVVYDLQFMANLQTVLKNTPSRTIANYMVWRTVMEQLQYLNGEARHHYKEFENGIKGQGMPQEQSEECVQEVQSKMRTATASMYVRRFFSDEAKKVAKEMVQNIGQEMLELLKSVDWMDDATKRAAMLKAKVMRYRVGYPDELLQNETLEKHYEGLGAVQSDRYLESVLELNKFHFKQSFSKFHTLVNKTSWTSMGAAHADVVNAYYNLAENSLSIPAGILQGAFFARDRPQYLNYGAIGSAIGHEVTHAFDDRGRLFNMDGVLFNWWHEETQTHFKKKVLCIIDQYSNYTDKQVNVQLNGVITQGENIADNAGVMLAYRAYTRHASRHGSEPRLPLPALPPRPPLTARQLFWVGFAMPWCAKFRSKNLRITLKTSEHLPGEYRVNGALSNQEEFAKDFSCPSGSRMNPVKKCRLW